MQWRSTRIIKNPWIRIPWIRVLWTRVPWVYVPWIHIVAVGMVFAAFFFVGGAYHADAQVCSGKDDCQQKIKEYDFRLAIHNHGPDNPLFPNASDIWDHIKDLDPRIGICIDIGHTTRDGADPSVDIEKYKERIYDIHIKDVDKPTKEGKTIEMGRGIIDIPKVVATLRKINYSGKCSLEFEKDMNDPIAGIAESIGYFKGVMACK